MPRIQKLESSILSGQVAPSTICIRKQYIPIATVVNDSSTAGSTTGAVAAADNIPASSGAVPTTANAAAGAGGTATAGATHDIGVGSGSCGGGGGGYCASVAGSGYYSSSYTAVGIRFSV